MGPKRIEDACGHLIEQVIEASGHVGAGLPMNPEPQRDQVQPPIATAGAVPVHDAGDRAFLLQQVARVKV